MTCKAKPSWHLVSRPYGDFFLISNRHRDEGDIPEESLHWIRSWGPFLERPDN